MASQKEVSQRPHHQRQELCITRAKYRQGRKLTAVKVYTVNDESPHILVFGVPSLGLQDDLRRVSSKFGDIKSIVVVPGYTIDEFTDTFHIQYSRIQSARHAKRKLDGLSFYGGVLHVCYAPEMETIAETRAKLIQRRKDVACRVNGKEPQSLMGSRSKSLKDMRKINIGKNHWKSNPRLQLEAIGPDACIWKGQLMPHHPKMGKGSEETDANAAVYGPVLPEGFKIESVQNSETTATPTQGACSYDWTSKNKFIPRQIAVKKQIVFRQKRVSEEEEHLAKKSKLELELGEDKAVIETHSRIEETLKVVAVPNTEVKLSQSESFLNMD
ncbi:uncharacterized protein LOC124164171 [Ischnura elegans]|uniref:uncharacterized protein LOC124164171 n=1 Tax=Ischnura elegans TaxID=197161 RepID=UPI001ED870A9|nr:uncharacterized protein LOC124164171 [Ischnura elegans]